MPEHAQTGVFTVFVHSWIIGIETKFYSRHGRRRVLTTCYTPAVTIPAAELLYRIVERPGLETARRPTAPDVTKKSP
jgi:peptidoglycan/LPS O-acetylase OafA/YrhL